MTSFNPKELGKLVEDGISTINFIQQNKEDIQKTYGRSAIEKPTTKDRTKAWENFNQDKGAGTASSSGGVGGGKGEEKTNSIRNPGPDRSPRGGESPGEEPKRSTGSGADIKAGDAQNSTKSGKRHGGNTGTKSNESDGIRLADQTGNGKPSPDDTKVEVNDQELAQIISFDNETKKLEEDEDHKTTMQIRDATPGDLNQILEEDSSRVHKRLRGITAVTMQDMVVSPDSKPVKKGTDGNTALTHSMGKSLSESGATQSVPKSVPPQSKKSASAVSAPKSAQTAVMKPMNEEGTQTTNSPDNIEKKLDMLLASLNAIDKKLAMLPEMKEEIKNLTKRMNTIGLALSTVENYIKDMMIIIPKSGKASDESNQEVNPSLRPVVGRDKTRGLHDVVQHKSNLERMDDGTDDKPEVDSKLMIFDLDFLKSNAANFVPENDKYTRRIMEDIINIHIKNQKLGNRIKEWVNNQLYDEDPKTVYQALIESLVEIKASKHNKI